MKAGIGEVWSDISPSAHKAFCIVVIKEVFNCDERRVFKDNSFDGKNANPYLLEEIGEIREPLRPGSLSEAGSTIDKTENDFFILVGLFVEDIRIIAGISSPILDGQISLGHHFHVEDDVEGCLVNIDKEIE